MEVRGKPEPVRPRMRREHPAMEVGKGGDAPATADSSGEHGVRLDDVDASAQDEIPCLGAGSHHLAGRDAQGCAPAEQRVAVEVVGRQRLLEPVDAERARARVRTRPQPGESQRGVRSPAIRQPWFASTMISSEEPTARRTSSTTSTSSRQRSARNRSLTARTPRFRSSRTRRARSSAATSSPDDAYASRRSARPPSRRQSGSPSALPTRSQTATSTVHGLPPWKSTVSQSSRTTSVRNGSTPARSALELGGVRKGVPARVPRQPLVRPYGHERRLDLLARHRVPGRPERRVEREGIAPCLDGRDLHEPPSYASTVSGTAVRLLMPPPGPEAPAGGAARRSGCGSA